MTTKIEFLDGRIISVTGVNSYNPAVYIIPGAHGGVVRDYATFAAIECEAGTIELGGGIHERDEIEGEEAGLGPVLRVVFTSDKALQ